MKQVFETSIAGQFKLIEKHEFTGGPNKDKFFESTTTVFQNKDLANLCGGLQAGGNTILVGIQEHEVEGKKYYSPLFNVWD
jgi:hypothetical protein